MKKTMMTLLVFALVLVVVPATLAWNNNEQQRKEIETAKNLMYDGKYANAYTLFARLGNDEESKYQDEALYYAARCSYEQQKYDLAIKDINALLDKFKKSNWRDDALQLRVLISRHLRKTGDPKEILIDEEFGDLETLDEEALAGVQRALEESEAVLARTQEALEDKIIFSDEIRETVESARYAIASTGRFGGYDDDDKCNDEDGSVEWALNSLMNSDSARAVPLLIKFAKSDRCKRLRAKAMFALSQHETKAALDALIDIAKNEKDAKLREHAIFLIGQYNEEEAFKVLVEMFDSIQDSSAKRYVLFSLGQMDTRESLNALVNIAKTDPDSDVSNAAIFSIAQSSFENEALKALKEIYSTTKDTRVKKNVLVSLSQLDAPGIAEMLKNIAVKERDAELSRSALFSLAQGEDEKTVDYLLEIYRATNDPKIKEDVITSLSMVGDEFKAGSVIRNLYNETDNVELKKKLIFSIFALDEDVATDMLINIAENEKNPLLKKQALQWLSQTDTPKAQEYVIKLLEETLMTK